MGGGRLERRRRKKERRMEVAVTDHITPVAQSPPSLCQLAEYQRKPPILRVSTVGE